MEGVNCVSGKKFSIQSYEEAVLLLESAFEWDFNSSSKDSIVVVRPDNEVEEFDSVEELINASNEMWLFAKVGLDKSLIIQEEKTILDFREGHS